MTIRRHIHARNSDLLDTIIFFLMETYYTCMGLNLLLKDEEIHK